MYAMLEKAAAGADPAELAQQIVAEMDYQQIADLIVTAMADPQRPAEETAAMLRAVLGDRAAEIGRLLAG
jgi:hypothetical protein